MTGRLASGSWRPWAFGIITLIVALFAARAALAFAFQSASPEFVVKIDSDNPVAIVKLAEAAVAAGDRDMTPERLSHIAMVSIRGLPLNAPSFRLMATTSRANESLDVLGERMAVAHHLTRRDLGAELFLIEDAVRRNDVAGALDAYDSALRIDQSARAMLYPVLTEALREPLVRQRFLPYLERRPPWLESFLRFAVSNSSDPASMVRLAALAGGFPAGEEFASLDTELLTGLIDRNQFTTAVSHYRTLGRAKPALLNSLAMTEDTVDKSVAPISWQAYSIPGIDAVWVATGNALELEALLDAGYTGPVARKMLALKPGRYRLTAPYRAQDSDPRDTITWNLACQDGKSVLSTTGSMSEEGSIAGTFTVPAGCLAQSVLVSAVTAPGSSTVSLTLTSPSLTRGS